MTTTKRSRRVMLVVTGLVGAGTLAVPTLVTAAVAAEPPGDVDVTTTTVPGPTTTLPDEGPVMRPEPEPAPLPETPGLEVPEPAPTATGAPAPRPTTTTTGAAPMKKGAVRGVPRYTG